MNKKDVTIIENNLLSSAQRTVAIERKALGTLERALGDELSEGFLKAVEVIGRIRGRLIVTGVGKSGHIGVKIAATMASTGTPAFFVHAAEANHGDLGMIGLDDAVLALSKGGESAELRSITAYTRRFSIPLISVTANARSSLAQASDISLVLPDEEEACPHGLAPTTSALMTLALGDALAIALLEARGFTATDFHVFHPGGKLGASLTRVAEIMHKGDRLPLVPRGTPLPEAISVLSRKHFGCVGVQDGEGRLCGIVTEGDMARNLDRNLSLLCVDDIMTEKPKTIKPTAFASSALALINKHNIGALIVVDDDNYPVGLIHFHDLLRIGVA
ncbi:KpsF/GutQ family sugar-phosphate isomerase [Oryzifoliimicrobium ureilyticus]|uniref:KpsF/GutQ family sugar-phosphate isomerase n=1 Tax=Oryzifoliimicrobium ureilyticus TaxID=3113724 RepID=UPI0030766D3D